MLQVYSVYCDNRDSLKTNTWTYKVDQYLSIKKITNPTVNISEYCTAIVASYVLYDDDTIFWFILWQNNRTPNTWQQLKQSLMEKFLREDHVGHAIDRLRKSKQTGSESKFISEFRNPIPAVPDLITEANLDRFTYGLN